MSLFDTIKNAIFGHASAAPAPAPSAAPTASPTASATTAGAAARPLPRAAPPPTVDVEAVLNGLNAKSPQKLNWQSSIVDLMKLVGLDSSFQHRKDLAKELGYTGDMNDSASMNIWLHKAVMKKLAENGGKVPASLS